METSELASEIDSTKEKIDEIFTREALTAT